MKTVPFVSVLMTAYNRSNFISAAIESVLKSTYQNFELIIVDDCSSDNTVEIANRFANSDQRIKVFRNEKNLGQFSNRNKAAGLASGEYLITVDSDDTIFSNSIENIIAAMQEFPESSFGMVYDKKVSRPFKINSAEAIHDHFFKKAFLFKGPGGTVMRRSFFETIGKYPLKYGPPGDLYFNLKASAASPVILFPFEFVEYRRHEGQEINQTYQYLIHNYTYLRDALNELPLNLSEKEKQWILKKNKRRFVMNVIKYFARTKNLSKTRDAIRQANFTLRDAFAGIFHFG